MRLSVIIPAYNRRELISSTLRSILGQTLPADEVLVVDDGSTDDTAEVASSFGPPVRVIRQKNQGPGSARNTGFRASKGRYVHFFDSDDLAAANKHEIQVTALEETGADIAYGPWVKGLFEGARVRIRGHVLQRDGLPRADLVKALLTHWSIVPHAAIFRRGIVDRAGGFPEDLFGTEDQYMFLCCLLAGARVVHTAGTLEVYRQGEDGKITESDRWAVRRVREWAAFLLKARRACLRQGVDPLQWFGYRSRLWEVEQELRMLGGTEQALYDRISNLLEVRTPLCYYRWYRGMARWRGGVCSRLTGGRDHRYFRSGGLRPCDAASLAYLGYNMVHL